MSAPAYPARPKFFAYRFCRLMAKTCLANEIGPEACWMLTVIAHTEDAKGYRGPVTYFNEQLFPLLGLGSVDALARLREKAVKAGWLCYTRGGKGVAGKYWVAIPKGLEGVPDSATDEKPHEYFRENAETSAEESAEDNTSLRTSAEESAERTARKVRREPRENREESAEHSSLAQDNLTQDNLIPAPAAKPKRKPNPLFDAIAELSGLDPATAGGQIGKAAAALAKADPPYTPADVEEFGRRFHELCGYAARDGRERPTVGEIEKYVGLLRAKPPPKQLVPAGRQPQSRGQAELDFAARMAADAFGASQ